ncbi:DUF72 domain-containing protein [Verrucomicrobium sp. BvORR034]|uniref:DUF72 domain-containing protein n=1 Tax=Verrucomicrobium sp. BvORR034 TaxID=1396418 RepID=UPI00067924B9|nr:DUF72 domain-containing protein [Verrucomicrobium sp. BvORR034]
MPITPQSLSLEERRVRRAARREAQREANLERSQKMHVARLENGTSVEDPDESCLQRYNVGCSGWFYWHWRGDFYPADMPTSRWFEHYLTQFQTVELNAPFYSWPTIGAVKKWLTQAGDSRLIYTVKVCELITHVKRFVSTKTLVKDFGHIGDLLGNRMGCFLFQLPPGYDYTPARLKAIVSQLDPRFRNVVEFRHRSWWNEVVYDAFEGAGIIFCSCSGPRLPDQLVKTSNEIYLRFHGTSQWYRHNYTTDELAVWVDRVKNSGAERVWAYFNNDREGNAIRNAQEFLSLLGQDRQICA